MQHVENEQKAALTFSTALLAPWLLTSAVVAQDSDQFAGRVAISTIWAQCGYWPGDGKPIELIRHQLRRSRDRSLRPRRPQQQAVDLVDTHDNLFLGFCGQGHFTGATGNNDTSGPDGVLIRDSREIWAGDGNSTVKVFDVAGCDGTTSPKQTISTGSPSDNRADEMCYDPVDQLILVANNAANPPFALP